MGKEKRQRGKDKRAAQQQQQVHHIFAPKPNVVVAQTIFQAAYEHKAKESFQIALNGLSKGTTTLRGFREVFVRLAIGRMMANMFFKEDELGEDIHNTIFRVIDHSDDAPDGKVILASKVVDELTVTLSTIDQMETTLNKAEKDALMLKFVQTESLTDRLTFEETNMMPWSEYKQRMGWK